MKLAISYNGIGYRLVNYTINNSESLLLTAFKEVVYHVIYTI